ncbi:hypothetical protein PXK30_05185 [Phaeobacter gallaeciensis]|uniref:hypothetical protein n=1 Tax=Phaeobacter gallaeciensis TaxID=60890 RepID=UPI00237F3323|nr:hypothetical protein [Phaeobacter gallaeciensis]MDE4302875.1 hypothetical protein [Phaeobacter gallaeciensis]MDE4307032.1 hypothetical protein [Phaeobacter gallaeciensis]MDE4311497.1 hypothetical protein [Phaeobacter gallaeciensis]MDE4316196.1 hypothetical protein [Phaeobacter gallaeciensis]MDE4320424.1 hypothetical protein [Phaeobacter gallaeciensis]
MTIRTITHEPLRVLVGCETSGVVRRAFLERGHDAWSCDLLPSDDASNRHMQCDIRDVLDMGWDLLAVMHPPCTRLCNSGVRWLSKPPKGRSLDEMWAELDEGIALFSACWNAPVARIAVENPVMHRHAKERIENYQPAAQHVQPWWFGEKAFKATGLYLRGLPPLTPTDKLTPPEKGTDEHKKWSAIHRASPGPDRWKLRSKTFPGIAAAMADQWGRLGIEQEAAA